MPSFVTNLGATWEDPTYSAFLRRLTTMARLILFDKRGTGLSDPVFETPTPDQRVADLGAVLDAAGSGRAVLWCAAAARAVRSSPPGIRSGQPVWCCSVPLRAF